MIPKAPTWLMGYFPQVIVFLHFVLASALLVLGLLILCAPDTGLPEDSRKVHPSRKEQSAPEPLLNMMASALTAAGSSASNLVPVRAVFEDGKLRVEYAT